MDYMEEDFTQTGSTYDLILDVMARRSLADYRRVLNTGGICVVVGGATSVMLRTIAFGSLGAKKVKLLLHRPDLGDLARMNELYEAGTCIPVIDRSFRLEELVDAFRYYESGNHRGKIVIEMRTEA